jgi:L-ribulose-5-phosphate 3-epimerase
MINPIGIMQGRLSPPGARPQTFPLASWREEFETARACGFERIEWLVTADGFDDNPLWTAAGIDELRRVSDRTGVLVSSACADCFIARPLIGDELNDHAALLARLVTRCGLAGIAVVIVPILESAAIRHDRDRAQLIEVLGEPLGAAAEAGVSIALESDLAGTDLRALIDACGSASLGACYDTGNAAAAGHDLDRDLTALGARLFAVHIKDRVRLGASRPLGDGEANLDALPRVLAHSGYGGPLILETPVGDEAIPSARRNLAYLRERLGSPIAS